MGKEFVEKLPEKETHRSLGERVMFEMEQDISVFSPEEKEIIEKRLRGKQLDRNEVSIFNAATSEWWFNKYGFPYDQKAARNEVLIRKYAPAKEILAAQNLQTSLFEAIGAGDEKKIETLKKEYEENYPDQLEGIEALFGLTLFLERQERLNQRGKTKGEERKLIIQELTEYQFLLTHFIAQNGSNKEFLRTFWAVWEKIAEQKNLLKEAHKKRKGILSQVAAFKLLESLGYRPKLSHPKEDAFRAIDLWADDTRAIQVKGGKDEEILEPEVVEVDTIAFPGVESEKQDGSAVQHFDAHMFWSYQHFKAKIGEYGKVLKKNIKGYMIQIPYSKFDFVTGEPSEDLIEQLRDKLASVAS